MRTVRNAESIVHSDIGQRGKTLGENRIVFLFFRVETQVFQHQNLAGFQVFCRCFRYRSHTVGRKFYFAAKQCGQMFGYRRERELGRRPPLGAAKVGRQNERSALVQKVLQRRQGCAYAGIVGDITRFIHRHVVIDADKDSFSLEIDVAQRFFIHVKFPPTDPFCRYKRSDQSPGLNNPIHCRTSRRLSAVFHRPPWWSAHQ